MAKKARRPKGWSEFDALTRKLIDVPKEEVDKAVDREKSARKRKPRKKK